MGAVTIFRLLYVSAISTAVAEDLAGAMQDILAVSVANNRRDGVTGFLLCDGFNFAQALEGPRDRVEACFARICADPRNVAPGVRDIEVSEQRAFPRWSMCGLTLSPKDDSLLQPPDIGFRLAGASAGTLWQHLTSLAARHGRSLDLEHERLLAQAPGRAAQPGG